LDQTAHRRFRRITSIDKYICCNIIAFVDWAFSGVIDKLSELAWSP